METDFQTLIFTLSFMLRKQLCPSKMLVLGDFDSVGKLWVGR